MKNILDDLYLNDKARPFSNESGAEDHDLKIINEIPAIYKRAMRFHLDVRAAQNLYTDVLLKVKEAGTNPHFFETYSPPPFNETVFNFDNPLEIRWAKEADSRGEDTAQPYNLLGVCIQKIPTKTQDAHEAWRLFLFLLEDATSKKFSKLDVPYVIGQQYIDFDVTHYGAKNGVTMHSTIHRTHLCKDPLRCVAGLKESSHTIYCQEYENSRAIFDTVMEICASLNKPKPIEYKEAPARQNFPRLKEKYDGIFPSSATQSPIPSPFYELVLPEKSYRYEEKNVGTGIEHRFRYDVRRHPRIVNDRIIWIEPHRRGKGEYIPKVYKARGVVSVDYAWRRIEGLTRFRFIERIMIWSIRLYRRWGA